MLRGGSCLEVIVSQSLYFGQLFSWGDECVSEWQKRFLLVYSHYIAFVSWVAAVYYQELLQSMSLLIYLIARSSRNQKDIYFLLYKRKASSLC